MTRGPATRRPEILLRPLDDGDPRILAGEQALVLASRNAYPVVARRGRRNEGLGLAAGAGIALLLGGITFATMSGHRHPAPAPPAPIGRQAAPVPGNTAPPPPPRFAIAPVAPLIGRPVPDRPMPSPPMTDPAHAPVMVFDGTQAAVPQGGAASTPVPAAARPRAAAGGGENDQFAARVGGDADVATAEHLSDPAATIAQGTLIPAVLETAIDTDLPGYVRAVVSQDVRSFDGRHVLVPRSSRLIGQYKSGLQAGQTRAYVIWQRLIRPDGVSVALGSPAVDFSGRTGLDGKVDGHFMKRFGSAVLLSVVSGLGALGSSGTSVVLSGGGQSAASVAATRDTAIPPTIRVPQGQPIRVFTAKDLDFSSVTNG